MGIWPFRRKNNRKVLHSGAELPSSEGKVMHEGGPVREPGRHNAAELSSAGPERRKSRRDKKRKSSRDSKKLQRRTYSFSPGRHDSIHITRDQDRPPVPAIPIEIKGKGLRAQGESLNLTGVGERPLRASTQPQEASQGWERMPTLHKRSAQDVARRKSSKKRKEDHDREAEVKAMAAFMPTRPAADPNSSGRSVKRESKKMRSGGSSHNKSSDISLPFAESIHSSLSGSDFRTSYKLSALDMLAPRPTIKYAEHPRYVPTIDRSESKKRRLSNRAPIQDDTLRANKRVDELADDLNAGELRELMERDQKRREKKKIAEMIKAERRLTRRQQKHTAQEAAAVRDGTPPPVNMERGVLGREVVGLGIGTSAVVTSSKRKDSVRSESGRATRPTDNFRKDSVASNSQTPYPDNHGTGDLATDNVTPTSDQEDPVIGVAQVGKVTKASISPPTSPRSHVRSASSISQMLDLSKTENAKSEKMETAAKPESAKDTTQNGTKAQSSWTSFFKRRPNSKQRDSVPSSFSNTSRDSMHSSQPPQIGYAPMRSTSNIPKRTMSKFREDLPELPLSPPDSRVQSPEGDAVPPIRSEYHEKKRGAPSTTEEPRIRYDTPTSGYRSLDTTRFRDETPTSGHRSVEAPSPEPIAILSQSLASIDSEGSWLSGRRTGSKRGSAHIPLYARGDSASSLQNRVKEYSESAEELGIAEDEYFSRLSPEPEPQHRTRRASGHPMPSSDEEDGSMASPAPSEKIHTKWGAVARQPTVVHRAPRAKSTEGLLDSFQHDSGSEGKTRDFSSTQKRRSYGFDKSVVQDEDSDVHRARSVDLGRGHVRHISAGSAKLLDLKPKTANEGKRVSSG